MRRFLVLTITLAASIALMSAVWGQHGGGVGGGHGAASGPPAAAAEGSSHADNGNGRQDAHGETGSGNAGNFEGRLADNPNLSARLQSLLPPKMTLAGAAAGFKNQGQFIAALHVSNDLHINFTQLKTEMVTNHDSLGTAIKDLRPDLSSATVSTEVKAAQRQARADVQQSNQAAQTDSK